MEVNVTVKVKLYRKKYFVLVLFLRKSSIPHSSKECIEIFEKNQVYWCYFFLNALIYILVYNISVICCVLGLGLSMYFTRCRPVVFCTQIQILIVE